jgi:DNA mismatch endonuclease (patch repair protein)
MKLSKLSFCKKYNIEIQWVSELCSLGVIPYETKKAGRVSRVFIDDSAFSMLIIGKHYVECPICGKRMAAITSNHSKICQGWGGKAIYSELCITHKKKSVEQKKRQSECLLNRFKTEAGKVTRYIIKSASIKINSDIEFLKRKSDISKEIQNRPENKFVRSFKSKKMWSDPVFLDRKREYTEKNHDKLERSAANARKNLKKTSSLHLSYRSKMEKAGLNGFITEYLCGFYRIDEADPFAKIAVEIDGCYWHGCPTCGYPGDKRISLIDRKKETYLKNRGWVIIRIKEHELKKNPEACIEALRTLQKKRREFFKDKIKQSFKMGMLRAVALPANAEKSELLPISDVLQHRTPFKDIMYLHTEKNSIKVTEDHSVFLFDNRNPVQAKCLLVGDKIVGVKEDGTVEPLEIISIEKLPPIEHTFDLSVPGAENFKMASGILAHNSYSISGVSLDVEKSSKYESMKNNFYQEADKSQELAKRSIKIIKGLRQPRYGVGISSALGPYSRPGVQSRRNFISGFRGGWT